MVSSRSRLLYRSMGGIILHQFRHDSHIGERCDCRETPLYRQSVLRYRSSRKSRRSPPSSQCCRTSGVCPHDGSDETDKQSKGCLFLDFDVHFSYLDTLPCLWAIDSFLNMPIQGCGQRNTQQRSRNPAQHDGRQHPDSRQPKGETDVRNIVIIKSAHFTGQSTACVTLFLISTVSVTFWDNPRRLSQKFLRKEFLIKHRFCCKGKALFALHYIPLGM